MSKCTQTEQKLKPLPWNENYINVQYLRNSLKTEKN